MLNSVIMMGRLTADPELRTTPNGVSVCSFTIAVDRPHQKAGANKETDFFDCVAWRNNGEFVSKYFHKGGMICVQGYMTVRAYQDKNGNNRRAYEIIVDSTNFCGSKKDNPSSMDCPVDDAPKTPTPSDFVEVPGDDDLPF